MTRRSSTISNAKTLPSQAEATTVIVCGALPFLPQFLKLARQTIESLNSSVRSRTKHTGDYPTSLLTSKDSRNLGRWHQSDEPPVRRPTQEYIPLADLHSASRHISKVTQKLNAKGDERRFNGPQTSEKGTADLGGGIIKSIRIETEEETGQY